MNLASIVDHTLLATDATRADIDRICKEADEYSFASVCVSPIWVKEAAKELKDSKVNVCTVIGFPLGANTSAVKAFETKDAIANGATEVDMVINVGALLAGTVAFYKGLDYDLSNAAIKDSLVKGILRDLDFYDNGDLVSYFPLLPKMRKGLRSNIIRVNARSADAAISRQIVRLNELYDAIHAITPRFEGVDD